MNAWATPRCTCRWTSTCWTRPSPRAPAPRKWAACSASCWGLLRGLNGINIVGADVVEVAPAYDHADITSLAAATVVFDMVTLLAKLGAGADRQVDRLLV